MSEAYRYEPLPGSSYIRILLVDPAENFHDPIICSMTVADLVTRPKYTALSYSWGMNLDGDTTAQEIIRINGATRSVLTNLYEGLLRLRANHTRGLDAEAFVQEAVGSNNGTRLVLKNVSEGLSRLGTNYTRKSSNLQLKYTKCGRTPCEEHHLRIWIDAICIDQESTTERSAQVAIMAKIFQLATTVSVWLGNGEPQEDSGARAMLSCLSERTLYHENHCMRSSHGFTSSHGRLGYICHMKFPVTPEPYNYMPQHEEALLLILQPFLGRRYFSRRWIVQEVTRSHAEAGTVYWGTFSLPLQKVLSALATVERLTYAQGLLPGVHDLAHAASTVLRRLGHEADLHQQHYCPCQAWLRICQGMMCQDPRDTIFSLISLAPDCGIVVDYSKSVTEVFIRYGRHLVERHGILALFMCLLSTRGESRDLGLDLPSWVPDPRHRIGLELFWVLEELKYAFADKHVLLVWPYFLGTVIETKPSMESHLLTLVLGEYCPHSEVAIGRELLWSEELEVWRHHHLLVQSGDIFCTLTDPAIKSMSRIMVVLRKVMEGMHDIDYVYVTSDYLEIPLQSTGTQFNVRLI